MSGVRPGRYEVRFGVLEVQQDIDRDNGWLLSVGGVAQSYLDLDDPTHLEFDYTRRIGDVLDLLRPGPLDVLHVGGGAGTLARYVAATRPGSAQRVVDADDLLVSVVDELFGLRALPGVEVEVADGRQALRAAAPASRDVVVLDAFERAAVPAGMITVSAVEDVAGVLRPGGVCALNVTDGPGLPFARRVVGTLAEVFDHVVLVGEPAVLRGRRFANLVLAASAAPLPTAGLAGRAAGAPFPARVVDAADIDQWRGAPILDGDQVGGPQPPPGLFA
ncbi:spermidine synthase [Actinokineospora pegani]|uniref:spermidine synthase n=1 Tax=Actinokineospora pegani TaxID=2654637 RepID=UPI001F32A094|nr:fused MFS/spermidine synthase [Actinokineospora pegani]